MPYTTGCATADTPAPQFWSGEHMTMAEYVASFSESAQRVRADASGRALIGDASEQTLTFYYAQNMRGHRLWSGCDGCAFRAAASLFHTARCQQPATCRLPMLLAQQARSLGLAGRDALTVPLLMRAAYGPAAPRLVVLLREPSERLHSAFWEYDQYKSR